MEHDVIEEMTMRGRKTPLWMVTTLLVGLAFATPILAQDTITRRIEAGSTPELRLTNVAGDITIAGGEGTAIVIEATKRGGSQEARDRVEVEISERGDRVEVRTRYGRSIRRGVAVDFDVQVPRGGEVFVTSVSGDVTVETIDGETRVESVSGDLRVTGVARLDGLKSVSGDLVLADVSADRELEAETVSGSIRGRNVDAPRLEMTTVSGDVELLEVHSSRADVSSVSGTLVYDGELSSDGRYALQSHSGRVLVRIADDVGFTLEAASFSGDIESELPISTQAVRGRGRRTLEGEYGDGSARLEITSFSGDIVIERK